MIVIFVHILAGFLALIGLASVIHGLSAQLNAVADGGRYCLLILSDADSDLRLRAAMDRVKQERCPTGGIVAIDAGLDEEQRRACAILAGESDNIRLVTPEEFEHWLGGKCRERDDRTAGNGGEDHIL